MKKNYENLRIVGKQCPECEQRRPLLAPFGYSVMRVTNRLCDIIIFGGQHAWDLASYRHSKYREGSVLVLPPGDDPHVYWWPVEAHEIILIWPGGSDWAIANFANVLLNFGALEVLCSNELILRRVKTTLKLPVESMGGAA